MLSRVQFSTRRSAFIGYWPVPFSVARYLTREQCRKVCAIILSNLRAETVVPPSWSSFCNNTGQSKYVLPVRRVICYWRLKNNTTSFLIALTIINSIKGCTSWHAVVLRHHNQTYKQCLICEQRHIEFMHPKYNIVVNGDERMGVSPAGVRLR